MKLDPCSSLKLFINFSGSESEDSYKLFDYPWFSVIFYDFCNVLISFHKLYKIVWNAICSSDINDKL